jgi:DNA-binding NarL/FixJ family response regulator
LDHGSNGALRTLIIDRQPLFLSALSQLVSGPPLNAWTTVTTHSDEALEIVNREAIDIVLCDARAKPISGADLAARLAQAPGVRVILLADTEDSAALLAALHSGAAGFFTKDASPEEFLDGIEAVRAGHVAVGRNLVPQTLARLVGNNDGGAQAQRLLSAAERAILAMIGHGESIHKIAAARGITEKTVRNHLANIYRKLQLRNRSEAVLWAARQELTSQEPAVRD